MQILPNSARRARWPSCAVLVSCLGLLAGCGGVIKFADSSAIAIRGPAPVAVAEAPKRVEVKEDHLEITEKIQFEIDKDEIKSESHGLLDEIVHRLDEAGPPAPLPFDELPEQVQGKLRPTVGTDEGWGDDTVEMAGNAGDSEGAVEAAAAGEGEGDEEAGG